MMVSAVQYKLCFADVFSSSAKYLSILCMMFALLLAIMVAIVFVWGIMGLGFFDNSDVYKTVSAYYQSVLPSLVSAVLAASVFCLVHCASK
jgi:fumarate reductase subunit D